MRPRSNVTVLLLATISVSLAFSVNCLAQTKFDITPKASASWRVDSNYYRAESNEREVYTYLVQPGIELGVETPKARVLLDYTLDAHYYNDQDAVPAGQDPTSDDDFVGHTGVLTTRYRPFDRLLLGLDDSLYRTRDPAYSDWVGDPVDREEYMINRLTPMVFYEFERKFKAGLRYRNTVTDYEPADREDSTEHRTMFDLIYNLTRKASIDLEYQHWNRDYDGTASYYTSDQVKLIFTKQLQNYSFDIGGGYHSRDFDAATVDHIDMFTYRIGISGQNPPAPETPRSHISAVAELNLNDQGIGNEYYKAHRLTLDAGHVFLEKLLVRIGGYYEKGDYEAGSTPDREDTTYDFSAGVNYMLTDWLTLSVTAGYEERDSNLAGRDYTNNYYMAKLEFAYEVGRK